MAKSADEVTGDLTADMAALRQDIARLTETVSGLLQHRTQAASMAASDAVEGAKEALAGSAAFVQDRARAASGEIEASIGRHPLTAVMISFAIGMALGMISRSRG